MDRSTNVTLLPGCCCGLEDWHEWWEVADGGEDRPRLGHDPRPTTERFGDTVRLTLDSGARDSPTIELSAAELGHLLLGVEQDLADFTALTARWASRHLPDHTVPIAAALSRLLDLPSPACRNRQTIGRLRQRTSLPRSCARTRTPT
ncbi:hypothetical protein [Streptomyces sp. SID3343]|uniref:hypothetical protein n=1 Tax=Streptomyces sp. SID3343 TaxID=2690260 RepID=UPI001927102D|nr:hypothetical protein [Streptomyces sp. SID3343]